MYGLYRVFLSVKMDGCGHDAVRVSDQTRQSLTAEERKRERRERERKKHEVSEMDGRGEGNITSPGLICLVSVSGCKARLCAEEYVCS